MPNDPGAGSTTFAGTRGALFIQLLAPRSMGPQSPNLLGWRARMSYGAAAPLKKNDERGRGARDLIRRCKTTKLPALCSVGMQRPPRVSRFRLAMYKNTIRFCTPLIVEESIPTEEDWALTISGVC